MQLADIYDYVSPCFPEKYHIFRVIFREYHQHLAFMLDSIAACAQELANSDILKVVSFPGRAAPSLTSVGYPFKAYPRNTHSFGGHFADNGTCLAHSQC